MRIELNGFTIMRERNGLIYIFRRGEVVGIAEDAADAVEYVRSVSGWLVEAKLAA